MGLQSQFMTFFISPFSEPGASAELNNFLKAHRIINVEKRLIDGERGTGWVFFLKKLSGKRSCKKIQVSVY